jgi:hypothetical protein
MVPRVSWRDVQGRLKLSKQMMPRAQYIYGMQEFGCPVSRIQTRCFGYSLVSDPRTISVMTLETEFAMLLYGVFEGRVWNRMVYQGKGKFGTETRP